jgi:murein DD-endopeptidase MepM/ murein hydrolase activator NlpD
MHKAKRSIWVCFLGVGILLGPYLAAPSSVEALAQGKSPKRALQKNDKNKDGKVSRKEWKRDSSVFDKIDTNGDGFLTLGKFKARFEGPAKKPKPAPQAAPAPQIPAASMPSSPSPAQDPSALPGTISKDAVGMEAVCTVTRWKKCGNEASVAHGLFETGITPRFPDGAKCRGIDDHYAMDYSFKRPRPMVHGGIDMPAPFGTPIVAAAAGTMVAKFWGAKTARGIEIVIRHSPEDTGIPLWIFTQYTHFNEMPKQAVGQRVRMGEVLGPTGNSGVSGRTGKQSNKRRPAIHFAIWFNKSGDYAETRDVIVPKNAQWMDPNALYRNKLPLDSASMKALPAAEKKVPISVMFEDGSLSPADTKLVWPYMCGR